MAGLTVSLCSMAQTGVITGSIKYGGSQQVSPAAATISLLKAGDSALVKTVAATGDYQFTQVTPGSYLLKATATGFKPLYSQPIAANNDAVQVPVLVFLPGTQQLTGVTVVAKKPLVEFKADRTIVNVEANAANAGSNALEVLEKAPGVTVDKDGNISLKGKEGVQVMIDGRPNYLSAADLANLLRNMPAGQMETVEVMTNPPAKYEAAGNAGIINIKLKKIKQYGFSGNFSSTYTQGIRSRFNEALNLNYRKGKLNVFANLGYNVNQQNQEIGIVRRFRDKQTQDLLSIFDQASYLRIKRTAMDVKLGMDYSLTKQTTVGLLFSGFNNREQVVNTNDTYLKAKDGTVNTLTTAISEIRNRWLNISVNANLRHRFDSTGREITADIDYSSYNMKSRQQLSNNYFDAAHLKMAPGDTLLGNIPSNVNIFSVKTDYTQKLRGTARLDAGLKASFVKTVNDARYDSLINNVQVTDKGRTNYFIYEEQIQAAYASVNKPLGKKWETQVGLRLENTFVQGLQRITGERFNRQYAQLFPTVYISYKLNEANSFVVNYGRRIERPNYADLNPFYFFLDKYTYQVGNPQLQPQFAHNIELSHSYKGKINTTIDYSKTTDILQQVFEQDEAKQESYIKKVNMASRQQLGLSVNAAITPAKWLAINVYANINYKQFKGIINTVPVELDNTSAMGNISTQINFGKGWKGSVDGFYRTRGLDGVFIISPIWAANAGLTKTLLKNKATLRIAMRDIFWSQRFTGTVDYANMDSQFRQVRDSRQVSIGFTYRFGKGKTAAPRRKTGSADEEKGRVSTGG